MSKILKFGNFEMLSEDYPKRVNWYEAQDYCKKLGPGWRLPNTYEMGYLMKNINKKLGIGNLSSDSYWGIDEDDSIENNAKFYTIHAGTYGWLSKLGIAKVRPVRDI